MKFRMWFFSLFALLSMGWVCLGFVATSGAVNYAVSATTNPTTRGTLTPTEEAAVNTISGAAIGGIGISFFACTGFPLFLIFALLAWRNQVGFNTERRHQEQLAAMQANAQQKQG